MRDEAIDPQTIEAIVVTVRRRSTAR